jgi:DNA topoisomerase-1
MPGIKRRRHGRGFTFLDVDGAAITDRARIRRFRSLAIPPAWTDVWICPEPDGHLQVTARDARGRKQYRYHPSFREQRDGTKFERMIALSDVLWRIRERVEHDIALPELSHDKVMATIVWLLERTLIRVGSNEYAKANKSFGLTTLRRRHVQVDGAKVRFDFRGKSGIVHSVAVTDRRIARIVQRCQELPGHELFQYVDDEGRRQSVGAEDVNGYLREIAGREVTAKDFRTWAGTMLAAEALRQLGPASAKKEAERNILRAIEQTSVRLGNTRTVCRKYYIHPELLNAYREGSVLPPMVKERWHERNPESGRLRQHEAEVLAFLKARLGGTTGALGEVVEPTDAAAANVA